MKLRKMLNPKGAIAMDMEMGCRQGIHLERVCELWLMFHGGDRRVAQHTTPFVPPPHYGAWSGTGWNDELSKALSKAIKGSEVWEPAGEGRKSRFKLLKGGPKVTPAGPAAISFRRLVSWPALYTQWQSGALERGILDTIECLPKVNRKRLRKLRDG